MERGCETHYVDYLESTNDRSSLYDPAVGYRGSVEYFLLIDHYDYPLHPLFWGQDDVDMSPLCAVRL